MSEFKSCRQCGCLARIICENGLCFDGLCFGCDVEWGPEEKEEAQENVMDLLEITCAKFFDAIDGLCEVFKSFRSIPGFCSQHTKFQPCEVCSLPRVEASR